MAKSQIIISAYAPRQKDVLWAKPSGDKYELFINASGVWKPAGDGGVERNFITSEQLNAALQSYATTGSLQELNNTLMQNLGQINTAAEMRLSNAMQGIVGSATDSVNANTINGVRNYAKAYTDSKLEGIEELLASI